MAFVHKLPYGATVIALLALCASAPDVVAQNLTGYCLDNKEAGCQDRYIPFSGRSIELCEEVCTLTNPTSIRGLNATLYDFACRTHLHTSHWAGRVMILKQSGLDGARTYLVSERDTLPIVRCR